MSECKIYQYGGTLQNVPDAKVAIQYIFGSEGKNNEATPLDPYVHDRAERMNYIQRITQCSDVVTLCRTVLVDLYSNELADFSDSRTLVKSDDFIQALIPLFTFDEGKTIKNIRRSIRKYVLGEEIK